MRKYFLRNYCTEKTPNDQVFSYRVMEKYSKPRNIDPFSIYLQQPITEYNPNFNLIKYWNNYSNKELRNMALDIISIPATSSNVERLFSSSKLVDKFNRQKMLPSTKGILILSKGFWLYQLKLKRSKYCFVFTI